MIHNWCAMVRTNQTANLMENTTFNNVRVSFLTNDHVILSRFLSHFCLFSMCILSIVMVHYSPTEVVPNTVAHVQTTDREGVVAMRLLDIRDVPCVAKERVAVSTRFQIFVPGQEDLRKRSDTGWSRTAGGSKRRVKFLLGDVAHDLTSLGHFWGSIEFQWLKSGVEMDFGLVERTSGHRFFWWRYSLLLGSSIFRFTPVSWADILSRFWHGKCRDKRDRVFGVLSLVPEELGIEVSYEAGATYLFRHVLEKLMNERPTDELLLLGAILVEALEITTENDRLDQLPAETTTNMAISPPTWVEGVIEAVHTDDNGDEHILSLSILCMLITIDDAYDTHVFEYAVEENVTENGVVVRYARAHEFVSGHPANLHHHGHLVKIDKIPFFVREACSWVQKPSEDVLYSRVPCGESSPVPNPLRAWTSTKATNVSRPPIPSIASHQTPQLTLPRRHWPPQRTHIEPNASHVLFDTFLAVQAVTRDEIIVNVEEPKVFIAPTSRGMLLRKAIPKDSVSTTATATPARKNDNHLFRRGMK
jgi:hypothetical protein